MEILRQKDALWPSLGLILREPVVNINCTAGVKDVSGGCEAWVDRAVWAVVRPGKVLQEDGAEETWRLVEDGEALGAALRT